MQIEKLVVDSSGSPTTVEITYENKDKFLDETIDDSIRITSYNVCYTKLLR